MATQRQTPPKAEPPARFEGWKGDFVGFFTGLEIENSKPYFEANRRRYEQDVRGPMVRLLAELEPRYGSYKLFRINRDIRFSADKSPYKTNIAGNVGRYYVHLDARRFFVAGGAWQPDSAWLGAYREAVAGKDGERFARIVEDARSSGLNIGEDPLKTAPRGYPADHPRIELLRWRHVVFGRGWDLGPWIASRKALDRVVEAIEAMTPGLDWLDQHVPARRTVPEH